MPKNDIGYLFCVCTLLLSAVLNAVIFGDIAGLVLSLKKEETKIQDINDRNNNVMDELNLSSDLTEGIREFFQKTIKVQIAQESFNDFLD